MHLIRYDEHHGAGRLGRHIEHDERSRAFAVTRQTTQLTTTLHRRRVPIYDQGDLGSCTGNALAGAMSTAPFTHRFNEPTAIRVYKAATIIDGFPGAYPPDDTGSSGLAVCKVALDKGWIRRYDHAFTVNAALAALVAGPVITGVAWYDSFDRPDEHGLCTIRPGAYVRGGHEVCVVGIDVEAQTVRFANSWGPGWGDGGYGVWSWSTWEQLLADDGDVTVPVV